MSIRADLKRLRHTGFTRWYVDVEVLEVLSFLSLEALEVLSFLRLEALEVLCLEVLKPLSHAKGLMQQKAEQLAHSHHTAEGRRKFVKLEHHVPDVLLYLQPVHCVNNQQSKAKEEKEDESKGRRRWKLTLV